MYLYDFDTLVFKFQSTRLGCISRDPTNYITFRKPGVMEKVLDQSSSLLPSSSKNGEDFTHFRVADLLEKIGHKLVLGSKSRVKGCGLYIYIFAEM